MRANGAPAPAAAGETAGTPGPAAGADDRSEFARTLICNAEVALAEGTGSPAMLVLAAVVAHCETHSAAARAWDWDSGDPLADQWRADIVRELSELAGVDVSRYLRTWAGASAFTRLKTGAAPLLAPARRPPAPALRRCG